MLHLQNKLLEISSNSLRANIIKLPSGKFLTAGQNQFQALWTRDFCHSVRGLLSLGETAVCENHLAFLLKSLRSDGLVPRVLDHLPVQLRVGWQSCRKLVPFFPGLPFREPLYPQYTDEYGSNAYDSNVLVILAALMMSDEFFNRHEFELKMVWDWYEDKFHDELIRQKAFSDWQDTTRREGKTFLLNLFYFVAATRLKKKGWKIENDLTAMKEKMVKFFWNGELFLSLQDQNVVSIEGNLFALECEEFLNPTERGLLWENLKNHFLVTNDHGIGRCSYPEWSKKDLAWHTKAANLQHYHGSLTWSWIAGLGLAVSSQMNDNEFVEIQLRHIERLLGDGPHVSRIYDPENDFQPWKSWPLSSEGSFAWGASYIVHALKLLESKS